MSDQNTQNRIPAEGLKPEDIFSQMEEMRQDDIKWKEGRSWSLVYHVDDEHKAFLEEAYRQFFSENYLNPFAFGSLKKMEEEVIKMSSALLNGCENAAGTMTSGGTESIFMAVYTYRERARKLKPSIKSPEMVVPNSIHPAFEKAAHMLNIKVRKASVDRQLAADPLTMEKLINRNTIFIAASAPSYPHGIMDPIPAIGKLAEKYKLPFHVDSCIGGFMLPWVEQLGFDLPEWDFRVPGVTSISADIHKFGYAAKGASMLLYRSMDYLKYQFFVATEWSGGIYASPTLMGSRPGGAISAAWASMKKMGQEGYLRIAAEIMQGVQHMKAELQAIPGVQVLGSPCMNIMAFNTVNNKPDIFLIADQMEKKGWMLDRQQSPNCVHLTIMPHHLGVMDEYVADLRQAIEYAAANPKETAQGNAALYGLMARIPFRGMVEKNVRSIFEQMYTFGKKSANAEEEAVENNAIASDSPAWMGKLNRVLTGWGRLKLKLKKVFQTQ